MSQQLDHLRVVLASPSDVPIERRVLRTIIDEVNRDTARPKGCFLELWQWETDAIPSFHPFGPQGAIDEVLRIDNCDLLIAVFWHRFGTRTADGRTGTEHELDLAIRSWVASGTPHIMVYFNRKPYDPKSSEEIQQWDQVLRLRNELSAKKCLWWTYRGTAEFSRLTAEHLRRFIERRKPPQSTPTHSDYQELVEARQHVGAGLRPVAEILPTKERKWLTEAANSPAFSEIRASLGAHLTIEFIRLLSQGSTGGAKQFLEAGCAILEPETSHLLRVATEALNYIQRVGPRKEQATAPQRKPRTSR